MKVEVSHAAYSHLRDELNRAMDEADRLRGQRDDLMTRLEAAEAVAKAADRVSCEELGFGELRDALEVWKASR